MAKLSPFLEGVLSAFMLLPNPVSANARYTQPNTDIYKTGSTAQDWQAIGNDLSIASKKTANSINMVRYESKTA